MAVLYNNTGMWGDVIGGLTNITGSLFLTLLVMLILLFVFCMMFRIPVEATAILVVPVCIVMMAFSGALIPVGGLLLIYLAILFAKNLPI